MTMRGAKYMSNKRTTHPAIPQALIELIHSRFPREAADKIIEAIRRYGDRCYRVSRRGTK